MANQGLFVFPDYYWDTVNLVTSDFISSGTTQQTVTGLSIAVLANHKYEFESVLVGQCSDTNGVNFAVSFSAAGATGTYVSHGASTSTSAQSAAGNVIGTPETTAYWVFSTTDSCVVLKGIMILGANAGNITLDVQKVTGGTVTVRRGSSLKIKKLV